MPEVIIAGAGVAGLTAAHRLLERGFTVTLVEARNEIGGKLGAHPKQPEPETPAEVPKTGETDWEEHAYHMYLNWYHNFWELMDEIGTRGNFMAMPFIRFIKRDRPGRRYQLKNFGSFETMGQNVASGLAGPADMFIYAYSLFDLISRPVFRPRRFDETSVLEFMTSLPYMTNAALRGSTRTLAEAFACPTYLSSSRSYRTFIRYGFRLPKPSMWLLRGNTHDCIFAPWRTYLQNQHGTRFRVLTGKRVDGVALENGQVHHISVHKEADIEVGGDLILAVPPNQLGPLVSYEIAQHAPRLANVRRLQSKPMISLDLYFNRKLGHIPRGVTVLLHSRHRLSFLDQSQIWSGWNRGTFLNVVASDADPIVHFERDRIVDLITRELQHYLSFSHADIAGHNLRTNVGEELFLNEVGSWQYRPRARTGIPNLFIAGDFCQTVIDVVTIEGAVVSGLNAAEAVRRKRGVGDRIKVIEPEAYPTLPLTALACAERPLAYAAKAVSLAGDMLSAARRQSP